MWGNVRSGNMGGNTVPEKRKTCTNCGLPMGIGRGNIWHANGVITASYPPHIRGTLFDVDEMNGLFPALSERIGFDITRLVVEGKRKDAKRYADSLAGNLKAMGRDLDPMMIYEMVLRFVPYWGLDVESIVEYREGERLVLEAHDPYSKPMSLGDWAGIFESAEKKRGEPRWREEDGKTYIEVTAVEGEPELEERIEQEVEMGIPFVEEGDLQYIPCPECGVPLEVSRQFAWDADNALIVEKDSGKRFVLHNTNGIAAVVRVLREELGGDIDSMFTEISRDYAHGYYERIKEDTSLDAELTKFPLRSWGRPAKLRHLEKGYRLKVVNPYSTPILAGRVWGMIEVFEGRSFTVQDLSGGEDSLDISLAS